MKGGANQSTQIGVVHHDGPNDVEPVELTGKRGGGVHAARTTSQVDLQTKYSWEDTRWGPCLSPASINWDVM